jgi:hypothetical protein
MMTILFIKSDLIKSISIDSVKTINTNVYVNIDSPKIVERVANYEKPTDPRDFIFHHDSNKLLTCLRTFFQLA